MDSRLKALLFFSTIVILLPSFAAESSQMTINPPDMDIFNQNESGKVSGILLSPHRGGMDSAPENTLMAFENSYEHGIKSSEFDIRKTADNELVVIHDGTPKDHTEGRLTRPVAEYKLEDLVGTPAPSNYIDNKAKTPPTVSAEKADNATIPSYAETLDFFEERDMVARVDLKPTVRENSESSAMAYEMVEEREMVENAIFISFPSDCYRDKIIPNVVSLEIAPLICEFEGLETIEEVSGGESITAALHDGSMNNHASDLEIFMENAEEAGIDVIVPTWDRDFDHHCDRMEFVENARNQGFDVAFMGTGSDNKMEELSYRPKWTSADSIGWLKGKAEKFENQTYGEGRNYLAEKDEHDCESRSLELIQGGLEDGLYSVGHGSLNGVNEVFGGSLMQGSREIIGGVLEGNKILAFSIKESGKGLALFD